ncbi:phage baseplate assembly protein V [Lutibacter citreus]|uniref:phage baseplate assembly protein V n=1 Tax=Lutibacter citreus TaxID=2138210 RepID=UPI000DBEA342|nr:phage baseplate assembly protein V [Lutibacter citreus]
MSITPYIPKYKVLQIEIHIDGVLTELHTYLKKVEIHYELNKIPSAKLRFIEANPDIGSGKQYLEKVSLEINKLIEIKISSNEGMKTIFKGMIFRLEKNVYPEVGFEIKLDCKDTSINLIAELEQVANENFETKMNRFLQKVNVTKNGSVDLETYGEEIVTKNPGTSAWDYIVGYMDSLGFMTNMREGEYNIYNSIEPEKTIKYVAKNGTNVFEFEAKEEEIVGNVELRYWNPKDQRTITVTSPTEATNTSGTEVLEMGTISYKKETIEQMAKARAAKHSLVSIKGKLKTYGNISTKCGEYLQTEKVNSKIDGKPLLISVEHHIIENGCWDTSYNFGLENNNSFAENISSSSTNTAQRIGQTNNVNGLQIGVVTQIVDDPENEFRIKVRIPSTLPENDEGVWARLSSIQAGNERGGFFIPEIDDEVIIGCFNNNPDTPVILGKLYSSANPPPLPITEDNYVQGFVSKENTKILINDEDKSVEISTDNGNKLLISDNEKGFVLEDENGNKLIMNQNGITLESASDINLKASGNITIEGIQNTIKASGVMEISGSLIQLN